MERISTVARDRGARQFCWNILALACIAGLGLMSVTRGADPVRPGGTKRPQRPQAVQRSNAEPSEVAQDTVDSVGSDRASAAGSSSADNPSEGDQLPPHVHPQHPLAPALKMAYASRATMRSVRDYTAQFVKKELVGTRYITQSMDLKFREQPFSVYLRFRDPHEGRQVLYVSGANNDNILVQEAGIKGLVGPIPIKPTDPRAMSESRHPITSIGISNMLETIIRQWEEEAKYQGVVVDYYPNAKLGDFPVRCIRTTYKQRYRQFRFHTTRLYLDDKSLFPVRAEQYDWPQVEGQQPLQVELYMYSGVRTNQNLSDQAFDPRSYGLAR